MITAVTTPPSESFEHLLDPIVKMIWFCDHVTEAPLSSFGKLHPSVTIKPDGTCHRMKRCPECIKKILEAR